MVYVLFFGSGASALIYEVVWVRVFANVFGNTIYSAAIVTAVFMLGLGAGGYAAGLWADRRYAAQRAPAIDAPRASLLRAFASLEAAIGVLGLALSLLLPHLGDLSAAVSSYVRDGNGWFVLSATSYAARAAIAFVLLTPATLLMGATLTVLIRHLLRGAAPPRERVALLYGANTLGAALGCFLTDFALVPSVGLRATQSVAIGLNVATAVGAMLVKSQNPNPKAQSPSPKAQIPSSKRIPNPESRTPVTAAAAALALTGFAGLGMEILWFRHFSILLGEFRAVFSMLLAVILLAMGAGSLLAAYLQRRIADHARLFAIAQALFVVATLAGLAAVNARAISDAAARSGSPTALSDFLFNVEPILLVVAAPALLMGFAFPLANTIVQRAEAAVGRRAGLLYLANTLGAVCGSLVTGFVLLPLLGLQHSAAVLTAAAVGAIAAIAPGGAARLRYAAPAAIAVGLWLVLPSGFLLSRALLFPLERAYAVSEGVTELVAVTDGPDGGRVLVTNGHPMSSTELLSQRYMRAMAHLPLLAMDNPRRVLVLCFGVGNTANAAALHPSVQRIDIVDLSKQVLEHAGYFSEFNGNVLRDPRVRVYVNDGRHHLVMRDAGDPDVAAAAQAGLYDLITLEPPPIVHAGVAALYTTEFYTRARARLAPNGYISQWLPAYGVPQSMILSMARSFVDVFPNAVLLSGASANLLLVGTNAPVNQIDPNRIAAKLAAEPAVLQDLRRLDLGTPREIAGMFVASASTLQAATRGVQPVTDDRPIQEYGRKSLIELDEPIPPSLIDVNQIAAWCPACFANGKPAPIVSGLETYLALLNLAYTAPPIGPAQTVASGADRRPIAGSGYLGAVVPASSQLDSILNAAFVQRYQRGTDLLVARQYPDAIDEFREALRWNPESPEAHNNLGIALASMGRFDAAIDQFTQALAVEPDFEDARRNLAMATRR